MHVRLKSVLSALVTIGMVAGTLGYATVAHAATTPPPFEPDPAARGCLNFYDVNGNVKTSGSINDSPIAAFAMGDGPSRAGDIFGTLYAAQPEAGQPSQSWLTDQMSAGTAYPSTDPATPANLRNMPNPLYIGLLGDSSIATELTILPHPASDTGTPYDGVYQIRFITTGPSSGTDTLYWRAAIKVSGTTWTQTWCPPPAPSTSVTLTATPASPQPPGTTVNLTANVSPTVDVGSVQFQDNGANLGPAVSVTAGTATTSANSLTVGTHSLTAVFTPTDPTAFQGSTSPPVS
ncbi:MAG TPA: Ig-like domain-containing protein, partial [Actinomycetota bacterium]